MEDNQQAPCSHTGKTKTQNLNSLIKSQCELEKSSNYYFDVFKEETHQKLKITIPDIILFDNGCISDWLYTDSNHYLRKKSIESKYFYY